MILFDPIFQGLAVSLMAGEVASTLLSRMAVPVLYYMVQKRLGSVEPHSHSPEKVAARETPVCGVPEQTKA